MRPKSMLQQECVQLVSFLKLLNFSDTSLRSTCPSLYIGIASRGQKCPSPAFLSKSCLTASNRRCQWWWHPPSGPLGTGTLAGSNHKRSNKIKRFTFYNEKWCSYTSCRVWMGRHFLGGALVLISPIPPIYTVTQPPHSGTPAACWEAPSVGAKRPFFGSAKKLPRLSVFDWYRCKTKADRPGDVFRTVFKQNIFSVLLKSLCIC